MNPQRRESIGKLAELMRSTLNMPGHDLDVDVAVTRLGGVIEDKWQLSGGMEAEVEKTGERQFTIRISATVHPNRRKFSVAHELGHLFPARGERRSR